MTTQPITSSSPNQVSSKKNQLQSDAFIKMMLTQLQHQDPLEPAKNQDLMAQMNQIGQMQSTSELQNTLSSLALQNQIGSAGNLIGKKVEGLNDQNDKVGGVVRSVRVEKDGVFLDLENGESLGLGNVTMIAPGPVASATPDATTPVAAAA